MKAVGRRTIPNAHAPETLLPTLNDTVLSQLDRENTATIKRRIELDSISVQVALE